MSVIYVTGHARASCDGDGAHRSGDDQVIGKRKCGPMPVMYLDWEAGRSSSTAPAAIARGGFGEMPDIYYRRMTVP